MISELDGSSLDIEKFREIIFKDASFTISQESIDRVRKNYDFLKSFSTNKTIYGINTGFGPMAQYKIEDHQLIDLQYNIIRSHSSGLNGFVTESESRGILLARLNSLLQGNSGIHPDLIELIVAMFEKRITPCIPVHGGVGASGDLVQLAHLALGIIGEGPVYFDGNIQNAKEIFEINGLKPFQIKLREGIALMNGVSAMTGVAAMNTIWALNAIQWSVVLSSMINEIMESFDDHFSEELNKVKRHKGQQNVAKIMRNMLMGSKLIKSRPDFLYKTSESKTLTKKVQEYYSLRCVPQVLGPVLDTVMNAVQVVEDELNSTSDNPIVDIETQNVYHGGNFHGDYISVEMDKLKIAVTKLSILAERQLNYLLNNKLNNKLPPFINQGVLGLNFGLQGLQFTATSTTAENMMLSNPVSVHNIPNNNDNQDVVSMGFNSALIAKRVIENTFEVLAIEVAAVLHAIDYLRVEDKLAGSTRDIYRALCVIFPIIIEDRPQFANLANLKNYLQNNNLQIL